MARRRNTEFHSPFLSHEEVESLLVEGIGALGTWAGGQIGAGSAGAHGGASGGSAGARVGAQKLTRLDGDDRILAVPRTDANVQRVRTTYFGGDALERIEALPETGAQAVLMAGVIGSGAAQMNPCVIQVVWSADEVHVTAHAKEGLIKQRTCAKALQSFAEVASTGQ